MRPLAALPSWLLPELAPTLRLATALTGSAAEAADLVAEALVRDPSWRTFAETGDPAPRLRAAVVRTFLRTVPGGDSGPGLDHLAPAVRAAVVLRDGEHLTTPEIATLMDRPAVGVTADLTVEPGRYDAEIAERQARAPASEEVSCRYAVTVGRIAAETRRRRGWLGVGAGLTAVAVTAAITLPTVLLRLYPPELREPGEWRFTHRVGPVAGLRVDQRILTPDTEYTILHAPAVGDEVPQCTVALGWIPIDPPEGRPSATRTVRVGGWTADYTTPPPGDPSLTWEYAPGAYAAVVCSRDTVAESTLIAVARAVRFEDTRILLPFSFSALPRDYRIYSVGESSSGAVSLSLQPVDGASIPSIVVRYGSDDAAHRCLDAPALDGRAANRGARSGRTGLVCFATLWSAEEAPDAPGVVQRSLDRVEERLRPAADLDDRASWFDATGLPG